MNISNPTVLIAGANRGIRLASAKDDVMTQRVNNGLPAEQAVHLAIR